MGKKKLTIDQRDRVRKLRVEGKTYREIAAEVCVTVSTVQYVLMSYYPDVYRGHRAKKSAQQCVYAGLRAWMIKNKCSVRTLSEMADIEYVRFCNICTERSWARKFEIDLILEATGLTYEQAFGERKEGAIEEVSE